LLFAYHLYSQQFNIERIGIKEGLLHSLVTGIDQDSQGRVLLSTGGGLCRYDGLEFSYVTTWNGISYSRLTDVVAERNGNVWVGSILGIDLIRGNRVFKIPSSTVGETHTFCKSDEGIWALTSKGVFNLRFKNDSIYQVGFTIANRNLPGITPIFQDRILSNFIYQSTHGEVFLGFQGNLFVLKNKSFIPIKNNSNALFNCCIEIAEGKILLGSTNGLYLFEKNKLIRVNHSISSNFDILKMVAIGSRLWMVVKKTNEEHTSLHSIDINDQNIHRVIALENGLPDYPTKIFADHENNLWILTNNGVAILKGEAFTNITTHDGLIGNKIWAVSKTSDGALWLGTIGEGMSIITPKKIYRYSKSNGLPDNYVGKVYQTKNGEIYVGTSNAGLTKAKYNRINDSYSFEGLTLLENNRLRIDDIVEDDTGTLWVATSKGLYYKKRKTNLFKRFKLFPADTGELFVQKLQLDTLRNALWVGTRYNGVFLKLNHTVQRLAELDANEEISSIAIDNQGGVWFGTRNKGIALFTGDTLSWFREQDGISSNLIYILYADSEYLWIGTNLGLDRLNQTAYRKGLIELKHYGSEEGLPDLEINLNGVLPDGTKGFWMATNGGLTHYEKTFDISNNVPPRASIVGLLLHSEVTDWKKFSKNVDPITGLPKSLRLPYDLNHLTFQLSAISFKNPKQVKYAWYLDGFDDKWIIGKTPQAIYSNLPFGKHYRLHFKAANSDGVWSSEVVSMPIYIAPPFWGTWWFRILLVLFLVTGVFYLIHHRVRSLKERQEELELMVEQRTVELKEQLNIIDEKNRQIMDSIMYAKFLQGAMLPSIQGIKLHFSDVFVFYRPKDYVSGDFYWFYNHNNLSIFAVADCTGHGVPGAIVSVICENALRTAAKECGYRNAADIVSLTNKYVVDFFAKTQKGIYDGMEIALAVFDHKSFELDFCGAKMPMYVLKNNELIKLKPSIYRIGWVIENAHYKGQTVKISSNDLVFAFTDGFGDQLNAENSQKFSSTRLRNMIIDNYSRPLSYIEQQLNITFDQWKGLNEQFDDVLVVGIKI